MHFRIVLTGVSLVGGNFCDLKILSVFSTRAGSTMESLVFRPRISTAVNDIGFLPANQEALNPIVLLANLLKLVVKPTRISASEKPKNPRRNYLTDF